MKDSEFIELLNLYLDHEISAADAARLEAEVQNNPARRKVYQQYCRMQKACKILAADFATEPAAGANHGKKVVAFDPAANARRKRMGNLYTIGTFAAAAACVAIVFVGRNRQNEAEQAAIMAHQPAAVIKEATPATPSTPSPRAIDAKPMMVASDTPKAGPRSLGRPENTMSATLVTHPLFLTGNAQADALMAAAAQQANAQFAWMQNVQLPPIQQPTPIADIRFEQTPATLRPEGRALGNRTQTNPANVEWTAFQFVK